VPIVQPAAKLKSFALCLLTFVKHAHVASPCADRMLEQKLAEAKSKKDTLKARAKSASASKQITDMIQGLNTSNALTAFEKMEEKVMSLEAESESTLQVRF